MEFVIQQSDKRSRKYGRFYLPTWGAEEEHAKKLTAGLLELGPDFQAELCWRCKGRARKMFDDVYECSACDGTGLTDKHKGNPVPDSVVHQVLNTPTVRMREFLKRANDQSGNIQNG